MGLAPGADGGDYSPEQLERLLRTAKVTQQSIQSTSRWMLEHRAFLGDMASVWARVLRDGDAALQVVALYVANEAMQVGARRFGRDVAAAFEPELRGVAEFVMQRCDEKVKRCLLKVVGIWKQRHVVAPELLQTLQNVCAGRPAEDPTAETASAGTATPDLAAERDAALQQMLSDEAVERALEEMPEVAESDATAATTQRLQSLSSATISADLLSDRMFQLESSLSNFHQACEAFQARGAANTTSETDNAAEGFEVVGASAGDIVWEAMEPHVFDLDVEKSRDHVQQYRLNLEEQGARREELLEHLTQLSTAELFPEPLFASSMEALEEQCRTLERLFFVCADAEVIEKKREAEKQAAYMESYGRHSISSSTPHSYSHRRSDSFSPRYGGSDGGAPTLRRHSSSDTRSSSGTYYDSESRHYSAQSKRPKLQHSHSVDSGDASRRWGEPSPSSEYRSQPYRDESRYSPHGDFRSHYSPSYGDRAPPPQHRSGSRWDMRPPPGADYGQRGDFDRRWRRE